MRDYARDHPQTFAGLLWRARKSAGMSQQELAEASGISLQTVGSYEAGRRNAAKNHTVLALARALHVAPASLLPGGPFPTAMTSAPVTGQFPPIEPETGTVSIPQEVLGMKEDSPDIYALRVVDDSLVREGIHKGDYIVIDPGAPFGSGLFLLNQHEVIRVFADGEYWLVRYSDEHTRHCGNSDHPAVLGRIRCHGHWTRD